MTATTTTTTPASPGTTAKVISVRPVVIPSSAGRGAELEVRVSAPVDGSALPVVVFSHGFGSSMDGYGPLANHWAAEGFVVVQPTHLDSSSLAVPPTDPRTPHIWRHRIDDLVAVLDHLDVVEAAIPGLSGRLDRDRIAVAGHSWGATTASALAGASVIGERQGWKDDRVGAAVLLAIAGTGGEDLSPFAAEHFPFMNPEFAGLTTPSLVVGGDADQSMLSTRGPDWWTDAFRLAPGAEALLTLHGAEHYLGGIHTFLSGHELKPPMSAELVEVVQGTSTAFLRHALGGDEAAWVDAQREVAARTAARVDVK
ncbi:MAG: alpha/beta fold hydrolase [Solirubrobacteraceae bacterium]|nr:alpha/beta fold hydrolase [Solirubrobacteraceae bacterium]